MNQQTTETKAKVLVESLRNALNNGDEALFSDLMKSGDGELMDLAFDVKEASFKDVSLGSLSFDSFSDMREWFSKIAKSPERITEGDEFDALTVIFREFVNNCGNPVAYYGDGDIVVVETDGNLGYGIQLPTNAYVKKRVKEGIKDKSIPSVDSVVLA